MVALAGLCFGRAGEGGAENAIPSTLTPYTLTHLVLTLTL